jgi:hypothetical protein
VADLQPVQIVPQDQGGIAGADFLWLGDSEEK